jgi:hypothetical protein
MKTHKTIITYALMLSLSHSVFTNESDDTTNRLSNQQETIISEIASTVAEGVINAIGNAIDGAQTQHSISIEQAHNMLQNLMLNLVEGSRFEINDIKYIVTANTTITQENQE